MNMYPRLAVNNMTAAYGSKKVVHGVSLCVQANECVALVGPNGGGKSTLIRSILSIHQNANGAVFVDGLDTEGWDYRKFFQSGIVLCPEGRHLFPRMTVHENLTLGFGSSKNSRDSVRERLGYIGDLFPKTLDRRNQLCGTLSGGEQQMVALGRALMSEPKTLILDEPTFGLAPVVIDRVMEVVGRLPHDGCAVIIAEQDVGAALDVASRGYILEAGDISFTGSSEDVRTDKALRAAFLGDVV